MLLDDLDGAGGSVGVSGDHDVHALECLVGSLASDIVVLHASDGLACVEALDTCHLVKLHDNGLVKLDAAVVQVDALDVHVLVAVLGEGSVVGLFVLYDIDGKMSMGRGRFFACRDFFNGTKKR